MGIINATPDSFSDGGLCLSAQNAAIEAEKMQILGADIIDIGAQSTRPGYEKISAQEEWARLCPVLAEIKKRVSLPVSVDTFCVETARKALENGASIINDVTGFSDPEMIFLAAETGAGCIVMHDRNIENEPDCIGAVRGFFEERFETLTRAGIKPENICFDPGMGFGKTRAQDTEIAANIGKTRVHGRPLLAALSRKRMIAECIPYATEPKDRDFGTAAAYALSIAAGADIIRIHNVEAGVQCAAVADRMKQQNGDRI